MIPQTSFPEQIKLDGRQRKTPAAVLRYKAAEMREYLAADEASIPRIEKELTDLRSHIARQRETIAGFEHAAVVLDAMADDTTTH